MHHVRLSQRTQREIDRALDYYLALSDGKRLAARLVNAIEAAVLELQEAAERWSIWRAPALCRILLHGFPYALVYRIEAAERVLVLAFLHHSSDPDRRFPP